MPYLIKTENEKHCVYKKGEDKPITCHDTREKAQDHLAALNLNVEDAMKGGRMLSDNSRNAITTAIEALLALLREQDKREAGVLENELQDHEMMDGKTTNINIIVKPEYGTLNQTLEVETEMGEAVEPEPANELDLMTPPNVPNYHEALDPAMQCTTCEYGQRGYCDLYKFLYKKGYVCQSWEAIEPEMEDIPVLTQEPMMAYSGGEMKAYVGEDGLGYVEGLGVRYGNPQERDIEGDWFGADTNFGPHMGNGMSATLNHRIPLVTKNSTKSEQSFLKQLAKIPFTYPVTTKSTAYGILTSHVLDLKKEYEARVFDLIKQGAFKWSSGTAGHLIDRDMTTGQIKRWEILEFAYTPMPAEFRLPAITSLKSWADLISHSIDASLETASTTVNGSIESEAQVSTDNLSTKNTLPLEGNNMSEQQDTDLKALVSSVASSVKTLADIQAATTAELTSQVKSLADSQAALQARNEELMNVIKSAPAIKQSPGSVEVTLDEGDRPFKSFGEQLMAVKDAVYNPASRDKRLDGVVTRRNNALKAAGLKYTYSNELVGSEGGFLLQDDFEREISRYIFEQGQVTSRVKRTPIGPGANALTYLMLDETSRTAGNRYGMTTPPQWTGEGVTKTATSLKFKEVRIKLNKLVILHSVTDELLEDVVSFGSMATEIIGESFAYEIQDALINGDGVGKPLGVLASGALVTVAKEVGQAANSLLYANIVKMWARMQAKYRRNAVWYINQDIESQLYSLEFPVGTGGLPAFLPPGGLATAPYGTLLGRPIEPIEQAKTLGTVGDIFLADMSQYRMIDKGGLKTDSSIHVYFVQDLTAFRYVYRVGGAPNLESAITPANGSDTQSAFVALATRA